MTTVYYASSFVPRELIAACGCEPQRLVPVSRGARLRCVEGRCPYTQAWLETMILKAERGEDCIPVFTTTCDQMRRA
ncbi:MAG: 2-hydroxyacyl-CoA dehydratase family protein [Verrucomicrobia bacterium]|nr:2-hydroxyacyl-CoA dehydratase family protein [Verrucomicrobiota bacterium]